MVFICIYALCLVKWWVTSKLGIPFPTRSSLDFVTICGMECRIFRTIIHSKRCFKKYLSGFLKLHRIIMK